MTENVIIILLTVFIVIFIATAAISVLSIGNWITIDERYKKTLFNILIVEVIGAVFTLFSILVIDTLKNSVIVYQPNQWVALDLINKKIDRVIYKSGLTDSINSMTSEKKNLLKEFNFNVKQEDDELLLLNLNDSTHYYGSIDLRSLLAEGFYNQLDFNDEDDFIFEIYPYALASKIPLGNNNMQFHRLHIQYQADNDRPFYRVYDTFNNQRKPISRLLEVNKYHRNAFIYKREATNSFYFIKLLDASLEIEPKENAYMRFLILRFSGNI